MVQRGDYDISRVQSIHAGGHPPASVLAEEHKDATPRLANPPGAINITFSYDELFLFTEVA